MLMRPPALSLRLSTELRCLPHLSNRGEMNDRESGTLLVVQQMRPDRFFTEEQQCRLADLMARWHVGARRAVKAQIFRPTNRLNWNNW